MMHQAVLALAALWAVATSLKADPTATQAMAQEHRLLLDSVGSEAVRVHMEALAADRMEGREAGTEAFDRAAHYVAREYAKVGLEPAVDNPKGYLQQIELLETRLAADSAAMAIHHDGGTTELKFGLDFIRSGGFGAVAETVTAPLAFAGFGIRAPEYGHDDFANLKVQGKILLLLSGAPPHFATDQRAYYSSSAGKMATASALGAVGVVTIFTPVDQQRLPWSRLALDAQSTGMRWLDADGVAHEGFADLVGNATLSDSAAQRLLALAGRDLTRLFESHGDGVVDSFDLGISATLTRRSEQRKVTSPNVLGLLPGSDPKLRDQYVLYTAHLDHLGVRAVNGEPEIYNGAYDNAAGVAVMLTVARALGRMHPRPRRSFLFAALTAEEKGIRGSDYLANNPPLPIDAIVANINIDMPFLGHPIADIEGLGVAHSTLHDLLQDVADQLGLALTPDPRPELVRLIRSDQFSFVKKGIPGFNLKPGSNSTDPSIDGAARRAEFLANHYHRPSDDLSLAYDARGAQRFAQAALLTGLLLDREDAPPRWNADDFFAERFARHRRPKR